MKDDLRFWSDWFTNEENRILFGISTKLDRNYYSRRGSGTKDLFPLCVHVSFKNVGVFYRYLP